MRRSELDELGYISPIGTVPSILERGILSHRRAEEIQHQSIALQNVQDLRANVTVPNGGALHAYANLYICPRNPMLLKRRDIHEEICVLRVRVDVLDIPNTVITDSNAASKYVRFAPSPSGLEIVNRERTFAKWWTHEDQIEQWKHSAQKCAEVLVPNSIPPRYIFGAYVSCSRAERHLHNVAPGLDITVNADLFFRGTR
jgi:hypothetical protein